MKTSVTCSYFPALTETAVDWEFKPQLIFELVGVVPVIMSGQHHFEAWEKVVWKVGSSDLL